VQSAAALFGRGVPWDLTRRNVTVAGLDAVPTATRARSGSATVWSGSTCRRCRERRPRSHAPNQAGSMIVKAKTNPVTIRVTAVKPMMSRIRSRAIASSGSAQKGWIMLVHWSP
jgi:hypothetical protein